MPDSRRRQATVDADLKLDPEPEGVFEAIVKLKDELDMNVELAAPDDFIPPVPGWRERSPFIARYGSVDFFHYDFHFRDSKCLESGDGFPPPASARTRFRGNDDQRKSSVSRRK